jgi:NAD(P)-dependent dehydrogenase (short-subunit alcohol dehydrogenase family)
MKLITEVPMEEIEPFMVTNLYGPIRLTQALLPLLRKSTDGRIVNVSSGMGAWAHLDGRFPGYRLSKAGLNVATAMFASALHNTTVKAFAVCPGWVKTDMGGPSADRSVQNGAETIIWLATSPEPKNGYFYRDKQIISW